MASSAEHRMSAVDGTLCDVVRRMCMYVSNHNELALSAHVPEDLISTLMKVNAAD